MYEIAYYEENKCHTEIICFILEYIKHKQSKLTVFNDYDMSNYVEYYKNLTHDSFILKNNENINKVGEIDKYDFIIVGTSDLILKIEKDVYEKNAEKFIHVCHLKSDIKPFYKNMLTVTPLNKIDNVCESIMPIWEKENKKENKKNMVSIVGRFKDGNRDIDLIVDFLNSKQFLESQYKVNIFTRSSKWMPDDFKKKCKEAYEKKKVRELVKQSATKMSKILDESKFIIVAAAPDSVYYRDRLTGAIPLGFNYNAILIIEEELARIYDIQKTEAIIYNNTTTKIETIWEQINEIDCSKTKILDKLIEKKKNIIENNNRTLDKLFNGFAK